MPSKSAETLKRSKTARLAQLAYDSVREAVEKGEISPGERISEYKVAEWLKISRTPVREGLLRLESEGRLTYHPRGGLSVPTIDKEGFRELSQAREVLERALAGLAALNGSGPELQAILALTETEETIVDDRERMYQHNKIFHRQIRCAAHSRFLTKFSELLDEIVAAGERGWFLANPERRKEVVLEHRKIAEAIADRDVARAEELAGKHIRDTYQIRLNHYS